MPKAPKVSVVMPSYNKPELVGEAIRSVLTQTLKNFEFIIVENSPDTRTKRVVESFKDKRIRYFEEKFSQDFRKKFYVPSFICNKYYPLAHGKYIIFLADDDLLFPDCLAVMTSFLDEYPRADVCYHDQVIMYSQFGRLSFEKLARGGDRVLKKGGLSPFFLDGGQIMFRKKVLQSLKQPYLPLASETAELCDKIFMEKLWQAGHAFYPVKKIGSFKRVFMQSTFRARNPLRFFLYQKFTQYAPEPIQILLLSNLTGKRRPLTKEEKKWFDKAKQKWLAKKS